MSTRLNDLIVDGFMEKYELSPENSCGLNALVKEDLQSRSHYDKPSSDVIPIKLGISLSNLDFPAVLVYCNNTHEVWYCKDLTIVNNNFVYKEDLNCIELSSIDAANKYLKLISNDVNTGKAYRKTCYLLDNPAEESYEVYYDSNYPQIVYGKSTPKGSVIYKFDDRFKRDAMILQLDRKYTEGSFRKAVDMCSHELQDDTAIIISDGAFIKEYCAYSYFYLDRDVINKSSSSNRPSDMRQGTVIAEINAAYFALCECYRKRKKRILYFYDNTTILSIFNNTRLDAVMEIKRYKELMQRMHNEGYDVVFSELHPKDVEMKDTYGKAAVYLHNECDQECRYIARINRRKYREHINLDKCNGRKYSEIKQRKKGKGKFV